MNGQRYKDRMLEIIIKISTMITLGISVGILFYILINGLGALSWEFLTSYPNEVEHALFPMIVTTVYMVLLSLFISTPIGVFAAIYLVEYAKPGKIVKLIRFATESLAGIPSIIYGLFGMIFFSSVFGLSFSLVSGAITLSIMVLPTVIRTTEEALLAVPIGYREGSLALGASKLRTIVKVVIPSAMPGILTAVILNIGRIVGETAAVYLTAGMVPEIPQTIFQSGRTLSVHMYLLAGELIDFDKAYATATVLVVIILMINIVANRIGKLLSKSRKNLS